MAGLGSLFIDLLLRSGKFETDLGRNARLADRRAKEIEKSFQSMGSKISRALGGLGLGISFAAIVDATAQAEKAMAALEVAVKNNAGAAGLTTSELANMASELQKLSTFDDEAIMGMQSLLLTFKEIGGTEFKRAQSAILDLSTALGQDLNSAAMLVGRALADPVAGMKRLSRAGVVLADDQKKLIKQLAETGQMSKAQGLLLEQLEARFGGAAQAARNTFGGALEGVKNAFGDLLEQKSGLPGAISALHELEESLQNPGLKSGLDGLTGGLLAAGGAALKLLAAAGNFVQVFSNVGSLIDNKLFGDELPVDLKVRLQEPSDADIAELEAALARAMRLRANKKLVFFGKDGIVKWYSDEELDAEIAALTKKIEDAKAPKPSSSSGPPAPLPPSEEFVKLSDKLNEQIALYGKVGKAAEISYQIQSGALDELSKSEQEQILALARRYDTVVKSAEAQKKFVEEQKKAAEEQQKAVEEVQKMTQSLEQQIATFEMGETATLAYRVAHGDLAVAFTQAGENGEMLKERLLDLTLQLEIMTEAANGAAEAVSEFASQNSESLDQGIESFEKDFEKRFLDGLDTLTIFQEQAARNTQDIIADTLVSGFDEGLDGVVKSFGEMIKKLIAQAVAADIAKRLFGAAGGGTGGGWIGMAAGALGYGGARAIGGPVLAGMNYRVNEREPEFFRPRVGGDIIPLSKMPNMGGGMVVNQTFSVRAETGERVSRSTEQQIAAAASRGMAMASRRNN
jgi:uncharacterized protein with GYD domain